MKLVEQLRRKILLGTSNRQLMGNVQITFDQTGLHEAELRRYFREFSAPAASPPVMEPVCIMLFTNRSGSSLVSEHLRATGCFTGLGEPLNHPLVKERSEQEDLHSLPQYMDWVYRRMRREGAMYGFKASFDQAMMLVRAGVIPNYFRDVRWVMIQRNDILSQAVSFSIASQTKKWHSHRGEKLSEPQYNYEQIRQRVRTLSQAYAAMNSFCSVFGIDPYRVVYEEFSADPVAAATALAEHLGFTGARVDTTQLKMRKQRDDVNARFRERFIRDFRAAMASES